MSRMDFKLLGTDGAARRGRITFPRGTIETPAFMPVGTYGTVKGVLPDQVRDLGAQIVPHGAGQGIRHQIHGLTAGGLIQHGIAAEHGIAAVGAVAVQDAQLAVVQ